MVGLAAEQSRSIPLFVQHSRRYFGAKRNAAATATNARGTMDEQNEMV
jgi:hypothetical protein